MMIELHYYPDNASQFPHMMLREIGCPFELKLVDRDHGAQQSADYLKLNPMGKILVLVDDGEAIFEIRRAIGLHLADKFPQANLAPAARPSAARRLLQVDGVHSLCAAGGVPRLVLSGHEFVVTIRRWPRTPKPPPTSG